MPEQIPAQGNLPVYIAASLATLEAAGIVEPYAVIIPDPNNWNDYGRGYFCHLYLCASGETERLHINIRFDGYMRSYQALTDLIGRYGAVFPIERVDLPFVSLLRGQEEYRTFVTAFGFDNAIPGLRKLRDAVVAQLEQTDPNLIAMTEDEEFHVGFMRYTGSYSALRNGARHFRRQVPVPMHDTAGRFNFESRLINTDNVVELQFDFTESAPFRDRMAVLIGKNGVGKTKLLKAMVDAFTDGATRPDDEYTPRFVPQITPNRVLVFSAVPADPYPTYLGAWRGIDYDYFAMNTVKGKNTDNLLAALVAAKFEPLSRIGGENGLDRLDILRNALNKVGLWNRLCLPIRTQQDNDSFIEFTEVDGEVYMAMNQRLNELDGLNARRRIDWQRQPVVLDAHRNVRQLSSGEYAMLRFAVQASISIEQGSLLLMDEPETHLHPNYISDLIEVLYTLLKASGSVAIIATHSAYIVREVSRHSVQILELEGRELIASPPRLQTFGASIDSLSQFIFGDTNMDHHFQDTLKKWVHSLGQDTDIERIIDEYGQNLNTETLAFIARELAALKRDSL